MILPEFIHLDGCNFEDYPPGGTLSFARQMRHAFGDRMALAGIVTDETPCGRWVEKEFDGTKHLFFGIGRIRERSSRPLVPLPNYILVSTASDEGPAGVRNQKGVHADTAVHAGAEAHRLGKRLFLFRRDGQFCCPVALSFLRWLGGLYETRLFEALAGNADCILAAADNDAIQETINRSHGLLKPNAIKSFPTRFNGEIFYPRNRDDCRRLLGLPLDGTIIAVNGRLSWVKGWPFAIQTLRHYLQGDPKAILLFIGDGEDRKRIELEYSELLRRGRFGITGRLAPADVRRLSRGSQRGHGRFIQGRLVDSYGRGSCLWQADRYQECQ